MSVEAHKEKQLIIDEIKDKFERSTSAVVIDYIGITVSEADAMRKKLREASRELITKSFQKSSQARAHSHSAMMMPQHRQEFSTTPSRNTRRWSSRQVSSKMNSMMQKDSRL